MRYAAATALLLLAACGGAPRYIPAATVDTVLLGQPMSLGEVRAAIIRAIADRKFATESEQPGAIVARLDKGEAALRVAVEYGEAQYLVRYLDSGGLATRVDPSGAVLVDEKAFKWIKGLKQSIDNELKRPAKERAEAEQRERAYQLLLAQQRTAQAQADAQAAQASQRPPVVIQPVVNLPVPVPVPGGGVVLHQTTTQGSQSITCCVNGAFYVCPSQDAFQQCMTANPNACKRDRSRSCK